MFGRSNPETNEPERSPLELAILDDVRNQDDDAIATALLVIPGGGTRFPFEHFDEVWIRAQRTLP